jgi:hypothetical protein
MRALQPRSLGKSKNRPCPWRQFRSPHVGQFLSAVVAHDKVGVLFLDGPWGPEAASGQFSGKLQLEPAGCRPLRTGR